MTDADEYQTPSSEDLALLHPPGRRRRWVVLGVLGLGALGLVAVALTRGDGADWQTEPVTRGTLATRVTAVGQLAPEDAVEVGSALSGRVAAVLVEENQRVAAGDVLAQLDPDPFEHVAAQARAQLASAKAAHGKAIAELENAVSARDRAARLQEQGASATNELEAAQLQVRTLTASVRMAAAQRDQIEAALADAEDDLGRTTIRSPIDGVVIHRLVEPGQTVVSAMAATALFEVASDLGALEVEVAVDEADVGRVRAGQPATFTVSAYPEQRFQAEVLSVDLAPAPNAAVVSYGADLRVDNREGLLRPGMTATAEIVVAELPDVLQVPSLALRYRPERERNEGTSKPGDRVYVLRDGKPAAVPVEVLGTDGLKTAVHADDLSEGDAVVLGGGR